MKLTTCALLVSWKCFWNRRYINSPSCLNVLFGPVVRGVNRCPTWINQQAWVFACQGVWTCLPPTTPLLVDLEHAVTPQIFVMEGCTNQAFSLLSAAAEVIWLTPHEGWQENWWQQQQRTIDCQIQAIPGLPPSTIHGHHSLLGFDWFVFVTVKGGFVYQSQLCYMSQSLKDVCRLSNISQMLKSRGTTHTLHPLSISQIDK